MCATVPCVWAPCMVGKYVTNETTSLATQMVVLMFCDSKRRSVHIVGQPQEEGESTEKGNQTRPFILLSTRQMGPACLGLVSLNEVNWR